MSAGTLILIGGREDKTGEMKILAEVAKRVGKKRLCIATVASTMGDELWEDYRKVFRSLGVKKITHLDMVSRQESVETNAIRSVEQADAVFFTGGDQLRITSELGGTPIAERIQAIYKSGGLIAGTSAGASVVGDTMLIGGESDTSFRIGGKLHLAPGLGYARNMIIDQHFAERGRIGRLLSAIAHHPKYLGIGIDENTSIIMNHSSFKVLGNGGVYVLDAHQSTDSNLSEAQPDTTLSIFGVCLHLLSEGDSFDLKTFKPKRPNQRNHH